MASSEIHIQTANRFHATIEYLCDCGDELGSHAPWVVTVAFYKALHVVEAAFACDSKISHTNCHVDRRNALLSHNKYKNVHKHYSRLEAMSRYARYLANDSGHTITKFEDHLPVDKIGEQVLFHRLKQVESTCGKWIESDTPLVSVDELKSKFNSKS